MLYTFSFTFIMFRASLLCYSSVNFLFPNERKYVFYWSLQRSQLAFCRGTCSCSSRSSNWLGCTSSVSVKLNNINLVFPLCFSILVLKLVLLFKNFIAFIQSITLFSRFALQEYHCFHIRYHFVLSAPYPRMTFLAYANTIVIPGMKLNWLQLPPNHFPTRMMMHLSKCGSCGRIFLAVYPSAVCWFWLSGNWIFFSSAEWSGNLYLQHW